MADNRDLTRRVELGAPDIPTVPSFQLDRGRFENYLLADSRERREPTCSTRARVRAIELGTTHHDVTLTTPTARRGRSRRDGSSTPAAARAC